MPYCYRSPSNSLTPVNWGKGRSAAEVQRGKVISGLDCVGVEELFVVFSEVADELLAFFGYHKIAEGTGAFGVDGPFGPGSDFYDAVVV